MSDERSNLPIATSIDVDEAHGVTLRKSRRHGKPLWLTLLEPLASLKLTVVLLALSIVLVFIGTLAQWRMDPFKAVKQYFRTYVARVEYADLVPQSFFPEISRTTEAWEIAERFSNQGNLTNWLSRDVTGKPAAGKIREGKTPSLPFPGGIPIGILMTLNLLAAHGLKFKIQARGPRVWWGVATTAVGAALTWWIVYKQNGEITAGISEAAQGYLWNGIAIGLAGLWALSGYGLLTYGPEKKQQRIYTAVGGLLALAAFLFVGYRLYSDAPLLDANNTRILWQLIQAEFAACVLLVGCYLLFIKRAGVVLLHAGILLMMFNELLVYNTHVEWQMQIEETKSSWVAHDNRFLEFAIERDYVNEPAKTKSEQSVQREVISIPWKRLWDEESGVSRGRLSDSELPFDLEVVRFFTNASIREIQPGEKLLATKGRGLTFTMTEERPMGGSSEESDRPVAWVKIYPKKSDKPLGVYMLSALHGSIDQGETISLPETKPEEAPFNVALRYQRVYKPYVIHLDDFRKDDYLGSNVARNFSSDIRLNDLTTNTTESRHIRMNDPMRYKGETLYQSGFNPNNPVENTTLQIVKNTGWMIPYMSCMIVLTGMAAHFLGTMTRYFMKLGREGFDPRVSLWGNLWNYFLPSSTKDGNAAQLKPTKKKLRDAVQFEVTTARFEVHTPYKSPWPLTLTAVFLLGFIGYTAYRAWPAKSMAPPINANEKGTDEKSADLTAQKPDFRGFGALPAVFKGRVKPLDTLARNSLALISRGETYIDQNGVRQPAIKWLLDLWADFDTFKHQRLFYIENPELLKKLGLQRRPDHLYSFYQLNGEKIQNTLEALVAVAKSKDQLKLDTLDKRALELSVRLRVCNELRDSDRGASIERILPPLDVKPDRFEFERQRIVAEHFVQFGRLEELTINTPLLIPMDPASTYSQKKRDQIDNLFQQGREIWIKNKVSVPLDLKLKKLWDHQVQPAGVVSFLDNYRHIFASPEQREPEQDNSFLKTYQELLHDYYQRDYGKFNAALPAYRERVTAAFNSITDNTKANYSAAKVATESWFNAWNPFAIAMPFYLVAFILALGGLMFGQRVLQPATYWLVWAIFLVHTLGMVLRMHLSGRPPVTNLYSSALFIGWGMVLLSLLLEGYARRGFGTIAATAAGFTTLLISNGLYGATKDWSATGGDTMGVMQAVLDTDFWLATHVVTVALGYATTVLAGLFGAIYLIVNAIACLSKLFNNQPLSHFDVTAEKELNRAVYGTICFSIIFSFVGTVLGGLWADDSWGRFWGWDPKENGALIIVLWNALVLHARWGGMIKERGVAVLSLVGGVVTGWSWFGVNELGRGLHSYGFTEGTLLKLSLFAAGSFALMFLGLIPRSAAPVAEVTVDEAKLA